jgi:hypothetical protein
MKVASLPLLYFLHSVTELCHCIAKAAENRRPPLWSEFLDTDPEIRGSIPLTTRFFLELVGLERGALSLVRLNEEVLE